MGLKGLEIGNAVGDKPLDDPIFEPFFEAAQKLELLLFVHPLEGGAGRRRSAGAGCSATFCNLPFRTTLMIERMIFKGMFEKYPNLRLCLSHGGGLLAFNIWRLDHSYGLRPDFKKIIPQKPSEYLRKLYFDTIVHPLSALQYLIQVVGADRVVIGTDYPMGMGDFEPVGKIDAARSCRWRTAKNPRWQRGASLESLTLTHNADRETGRSVILEACELLKSLRSARKGRLICN